MADKKRLLTDLRVIDLRAELEKRNLDKSGVRGVLIQRLSKYLEEEGHDPTSYRFDLAGSDQQKNTPTKRTRRSESNVEPESEETPIMEDMIVQDDAGDDDESEQQEEDAKPESADNVPDSSNGDEESEKVALKRENTDETEATKAKKACLEKEEDHKNENMDAEDSINLDLGEDELLNDEADNTAKSKKDDDAGLEDAASEAAVDSAAGAAAADDAAPDDNQQETTEAAATSNDGEEADKDSKDDKKSDADKKDDGKEGGARNLWVSGLSGDTRAKDLKQLCSKHGKVIGAKVVTNAKTPGSRCYGYVTMASAQDAENCIKNLHRTELHGRMISVEKAKSESESASRRQASRNSNERKEDGKENEDEKDNDKDETKKEGDAVQRSQSREKGHRSDKEKSRRSSRSNERRKSPREVLSFSKIWKERDAARARDRSRAVREEERKRRAAEEQLRERERRQRAERHRLDFEREKLRAEREKIEREKNELLRLERERHKLEREKLELERLELKRAQLRLEEERRKRSYEAGAAYRKPAASPPMPEPAYERDRHKRAPPPPCTSSRGQFEAPPPPRFELAANYERGDKRERERDYKRDYPRHVSSASMKYPSNGSTNDDARQPIPPGTRPKEPSRSYDSRESRSYRPSPPAKPEPRSWSASSRYPDAGAAAKGTSASSTGEAWAGSEPRYASSGGGGGGNYDSRYPPAYQPPPPGAAYPDRYRDYRKY